MMARDQRRRRAGAHAMPRKQRVKTAKIARRPGGARHAAQLQTATAEFVGALKAAAGMWRRIPQMLHPARPVNLRGAVIVLDVPAWQVMTRPMQTPAFGAAVMFGLVLAWLGAVAPSNFDRAHSPPLHAQVPEHREPAPAAPPLRTARLGSDAMPTINADAPSNTGIDPKVFAKLEMVLAELDGETRSPESPPEFNTPLESLPELSPPQASATVELPTGQLARQTPDAPLPNTAPTDPASTSPAEPPIEQARGPLPGPVN